VTSEEVEKLISAVLNKTSRPSPHLAGQGYASTAVTFHLLAAQQVSHHWLISAGVQRSCRLTTPEEKRARRQ